LIVSGESLAILIKEGKCIMAELQNYLSKTPENKRHVLTRRNLADMLYWRMFAELEKCCKRIHSAYWVSLPITLSVMFVGNILLLGTKQFNVYNVFVIMGGALFLGLIFFIILLAFYIHKRDTLCVQLLKDDTALLRGDNILCINHKNAYDIMSLFLACVQTVCGIVSLIIAIKAK